jgi:hypothetical protein
VSTNNPDRLPAESHETPEIISTHSLMTPESQIMVTPGSDVKLVQQPDILEVVYTNQQKTYLKSLINDIREFNSKQVNMEQINDRSYETESVLAVNNLFNIILFI